jgi:hypothetical protein
MEQINPARRTRKIRRPGLGRLQLRALLRSGGPAVILGLLVALLLQLIALLPGAPPAAPDAGPISRVTWSFVACVSLGLGTTVIQPRLVAMAASGLAGAPLAFALARATRRGSAGLLRALEGGTPSPMLIGAIKGIEYGCLGLALGWLGRRARSGPAGYALAGFGTGLVFGAVNLWVSTGAFAGALDAPALLTWLVNEVLFPGGCALIVWSVDHRGRAAAQEAG